MTEEHKKKLKFKRPILTLNKPKIFISINPSANNKTNKDNSSLKLNSIDQAKDPANLSVIDSKDKISENNTSKEIKSDKKSALSKEAYKIILNDLRTKFSNTFLYPPKPLSIGIHNELHEMTEYSKTTIKRFLLMYCGSPIYKKSLTLNAERINLKGEVTSIVTEEQLSKETSKKSINLDN